MELHYLTFPARVVEHTYSGHPLKVFISDGLSEGYYDHDNPELERLAILKRRTLGPGKTVFDIGSHVGVRAMVLAKIVGPEGKVVAVEPNRHAIEALRKNRELNHLDQLEVLHAAGADQEGEVVFGYGQVGQPRGLFYNSRVPAVTVDGLAGRHGLPSHLFIDVEGYEVNVLKGAREVLKSGPDVFLEVHLGCGLEDFGGSLEEVIAFFPERQYELICSEPFKQFVPFSRDLDFVRRYFFLLALAR